MPLCLCSRLFKSEIMVWVSSAAPAKSMRTASAPDKSEIRIVWVSSAPPAKEHAAVPLLQTFQVRNHGLGVLRGTCKEYADCLCSRQIRNQNSLGVLCATCKRACRCASAPDFSSQKSWSGCPPRHLQRVCGLPLLQTNQKSE